MKRAESFDHVLKTFTRDREFWDSLAATHASEVGRLLVYVRWTHAYCPIIRRDPEQIASRHFPVEHSQEATFWTVARVLKVRSSWIGFVTEKVTAVWTK
jgi:hypothetical protein